MSNMTNLGIVLSTVNLLGFYAAYLYGHRTIAFKWREYFFLMTIPVASIITLAAIYGWRILLLFFVSCFAGGLFEYAFGLAYHKTLNHRLWLYKRMSIQGHTSLLALPIWGVAGVTFYFLSKLLGL